MRKRLVFLISLLLLCMLPVLPALADDAVGLRVNSDLAKPGTLTLIDGISMITPEDYLRLAGADVKWPSPDTLTIEENGISLSLTIGESTALLNGERVELPRAPERIEERVYIPLNFVAKSFGFNVAWDQLNWEVTLTRKETRDKMPVEELLAKSVAAAQKFNTYSMQGTLNTKMKMSMDGKDTGNMLTNIKSEISGQFQNKPFQLFMKQSIKPVASVPVINEMTVETYMTEENLYIKLTDGSWTVQKNPMPAEFFKQQQDIQSNPLKAAALMKEMGVLTNYGNDAAVDGKNYYVVSCALDMKKFKEGYQKIMSQALKQMPVNSGSVSEKDIQSIFQKLQESMKIDYYYTVYINRDTLINEIVNLDMNIDFSMDVPAPQQTGSPGESLEPKRINTSQNTKGVLKMSDLGKPFAEPDVKSAKPFESPKS